MAEKRTISRTNLETSSPTFSSSNTLEDIKSELYKKVINTGNSIYFFIKIDAKGDFTTACTQDREDIENIVKEKESEKIERSKVEKWERVEQKALFWRIIIDTIFKNIKDFLKINR